MTLKLNKPKSKYVRDFFQIFGRTSKKRKTTYVIKPRLSHEKLISGPMLNRRLLNVRGKLLVLRLSHQTNKIHKMKRKQEISILRVISRNKVSVIQRFIISRLELQIISKKHIVNRQIFHKSFKDVEIKQQGTSRTPKLWQELKRRFKNQIHETMSYQSQNESAVPKIEEDVCILKIIPEELELKSQECFKCAQPGCKRSFKRKCHLYKHQLVHQNQDLSCSLSMNLKDKVKMEDALKVEKKPLLCDWVGCHKAFASRIALKNHQVSHTTDRPYECTWQQCKSTFKWKGGLTRHQNNVHKMAMEPMKIRKNSNDEQTVKPSYFFDCEERGCGETFMKLSELRIHENSHKSSIKLELSNSFNDPEGLLIPKKCELYKCEKCGKSFKNSSGLKKHEMTHETDRLLRCTWPKCKKTFVRQTMLDIHQKLHEENKHATFTCSELGCGKVFQKKRNMTRHQKTHNKNKPAVKKEPLLVNNEDVC